MTRVELIENHLQALREMPQSPALLRRITELEMELAEQKGIERLYNAVPADQQVGFSQDAIDKFNSAYAAELEAERARLERQ